MHLGYFNVGCFEQIGVSPIGPKWTNFELFPVQNQISNMVYFMEKIKMHQFWLLWGGPFWLCACLLTGQIWADQIFSIILNLKSKINVGLSYAKSCCGQKIGIVGLECHPWPSAKIKKKNILFFFLA